MPATILKQEQSQDKPEKEWKSKIRFSEGNPSFSAIEHICLKLARRLRISARQSYR
jgi:hypothetical protein